MSSPISTIFANRRSTISSIAGITLLAASILPTAFAAPKKSNAVNAEAIPAAQSLTTTLNVSTATPKEYTTVTITGSIATGPTALSGGGTVNFYDANAVPKLIGSAQALSSGASKGIATLRIVPGVGAHSYTAVFQGNATNGPTPVSNAAAVTVSPTVTSPKVKYTSQGVASSTNGSSTGTYNLSDLLVFLGNAAPTGTVAFTNTTSSTSLGTIANASFGTTTKTFEASTIQSNNIPFTLTATTGDFDEDGYPDLAYTTSGTNAVSIVLNTSNANKNQALTAATFGTPSQVAVGNQPYTLTTGDFNGDGHLDLAVANIGGNTVSILIGNGAGSFTPAATPTVSVGTNPFSLVSADFDGNGTLDLAVANLGGGTVSILMGNGDGSFTPKLTPLVAGGLSDALAVGDLGNGHPDLVVANANDSNVYVYMNDGAGNFAAGVPYSVGAYPSSLAIGDFDNDGKNDIAVLNQDTPGSVSILHNTGSAFTRLTDIAVGNYPYGLAVGDLLGNGHVDLATVNYSDNSFSVLANDGSGNFTASTFTDPVNYHGITDVAAADFNGDGRMDLAIPNYSMASTNLLLGARSNTVSLPSTTITGTGSQNVSAAYVVGTNDPYATSTSNVLSLTSAGITTTMTATASDHSISSGESITYVASLKKVATRPAVTGTVTFTDSTTNTFLCSANITGNGNTETATCSSRLVTGNRNSTHQITAVYSGDTTYAPITTPNFTTLTIN